MDWPRSRQGRPRPDEAYEPLTDARPVDEGPRRGVQIDPERLRRVRLRRGALLLCLGTFFVAGSLAALVGQGGYLDLRRKRDEARRLRIDVATLKVELGVLGHAVEKLKSDPSARERIAREQLGLVLPGEIDFLLPRKRLRDPSRREGERGRRVPEGSAESP